MAGYERSLELVKEHLNTNEQIIASVYGAYETKILGTDTVRNGVLLASNERVIFYAKKLAGYDLEAFPFSTISSIESNKGIMGHLISLFAAGNKVTLKWISEGDVKSFVEHVKSNIGRAPQAQEASQNVSIPEQIKKLSELKDLGILTEEEFLKKKTELLAKM